jgi:ABC-type dipeptide/oligopeptide/nickel transport system permease component
MMNMGDPIATMGGRSITRPSDRIRLTRQLGLDKPIYVQYNILADRKRLDKI